jgi:AcrR family transcriptional regulator
MSVTVITHYHRVMTRWQPDSRGRLEEAALTLFGERGYDNTTVAEIAERAGVTERTFFRHYADKREVLFAGAVLLKDALVNGVANAPLSASPIDVVVMAFEGTGEFFDGRRESARRRQAIVESSLELQERELIKMSTLALAMADALRQRGVSDPAASLAADTGITIFRAAFASWVQTSNGLTLAEVIRVSLGEVRAVTAGQ